jgi:hypothetical protein
MRTIKLKLLTQQQLEVVETNARTFGELKSELEYLGINWNNNKLIDRSTKTTFELDNALLPSGDSIMFQMPTKSESGLSRAIVLNTVKNLKEAGVTIPFDNISRISTDTLIKFIKDNTDAIDHEEDAIPLDLLDEDTQEANDYEELILAPGKYLLVIPEGGISLDKLIDPTLISALDDEQAELLKALKIK